MSRNPQIVIDLKSTVPVYRQIADALRTALVEGRLKPGDALPTVRVLAMELGVHFNTVAEAYRILADEGWLELARRRGAVVKERGAQKAPPSAETRSLVRRMKELLAEARSEGMSIEGMKKELAALAECLYKWQ